MALRLLSKLTSNAVCYEGICYNAVRSRHTKHWVPKWKALRRAKVMKIELPNFQEKEDDFTEEQMRAKLKEHGLLPTRPWMEKQYFISSTGGVFEGYVPPEGDGKVSRITTEGAKQGLEFLQKKSKSMMALRKVRQFEEEFESSAFCGQALGIYKKMHECLAERDLETIIQYVTERAYPEVVHNIQNQTIRWRYIKDIEEPRIVHARQTNVITNDNIFGQITVRFHSQQSLAIYDRFGRLMHGSEIIAKDVLEYVVFEKHLSNQYGVWRIHAKIIPDWLPPKEPSRATFKKSILAAPQPESAVVSASDNVQNVENVS